ncbi:MAG: hypothetical protein HZA93_13380 [Verrucomicrobia bacterium]|nr:hypothetical protein [Verrucomicrobiota bacterium]
MSKVLRGAVLWSGLVVAAWAEVTRVDIAQRMDVGASGYEKLVGTAHFAVDPENARNRVIADIDRAPLNKEGRVEFSADLYILRPKDAADANGTAIVEVSNRGGKGLITSFNRGGTRDPMTEADLGDRFLMQQGFTLVWVGWEFDVPRTPGLLRIEVPVATDRGRPITGMVRALFTVDAPTNAFTVTDLAAYTATEQGNLRAELSVRPSRTAGERVILPKETWQLRGHVVSLLSGFEPGKSYELSFEAANPPVAGLGFAAIRDIAAWVKHADDAPARVKRAYAFGISQSGRFLRDFLYHGFNTDERERPVYDAVMAHIAGAARLDLNRRWSTPRDQGNYPVTGFPFADTAQTDPVTGAREGLLENPRVTHAPKIFYTNTSVEYWGGGRVAALVHTDPAGTKDVALPENVRFYTFAGTQHGPAGFPPAAPTTAQQRANPANFWWSMRALLLALDGWVKDGKLPPASAYPTMRERTLGPAAAVTWPAIPGAATPLALTGGVRAANALLPKSGGGAPLPLLVPQVDVDGNELGVVRLPEVAVPFATFTGWNFRAPKAGASNDLVPLAGAWIPFPATAEAQAAAKDPRRPIAERYASRADYLAKVGEVAAALVEQRFLLAGDVAAVVGAAGKQWDWIAASSANAK